LIEPISKYFGSKDEEKGCQDHRTQGLYSLDLLNDNNSTSSRCVLMWWREYY
jgi:hypothetical protein